MFPPIGQGRTISSPSETEVIHLPSGHFSFLCCWRQAPDLFSRAPTIPGTEPGPRAEAGGAYGGHSHVRCVKGACLAQKLPLAQRHIPDGPHLLSRLSGGVLGLQNCSTAHPQRDSHVTPLSCLFLNHCLIGLPPFFPLK